MDRRSGRGQRGPGRGAAGPAGLPVVRSANAPLLFRHWEPGARLEKANFGVSVPLPEAPETIPVVVLAPLLAFDRRGFRLGYGGGYYDKLLSYESKQLSRVDKHITTIALAFEEQIGENIPSEPHDIKVDMIVTDKRLIKCLSK